MLNHFFQCTFCNYLFIPLSYCSYLAPNINSMFIAWSNVKNMQTRFNNLCLPTVKVGSRRKV